MAVSVLVFYTRRSDLTPAEFKDYMENQHVPLMKEVMGIHFPTSYVRRYVQRVESGAGDRLGAPSSSRRSSEPSAPVVLVGSPGDFGWDMMGEMVYQDELHMQQCYAQINSVEGQKMKDDEENFTDVEQLKVVLIGETHV